MSVSNEFLSYIGDPANEAAKSSSAEHARPSSAGNEERLFPGEIECALCDDCSFGFSFSENSFGRIICTNFRLLFEPLAKSESTLPPRFKVFNDRWHIPLYCVHSVYYVPVKQNNQSLNRKKFLPLKSSLSSLEVISCIQLHLKHFRVVTIDLRGSQNGVSLLNQILFFSRPMKLENIVHAGTAWLGKLLFNDSHSWDAELRRCGHRTNDQWRICHHFSRGAQRFVPSFPLYFVVPAEFVQHDLDRMAEHWQNGRFPVWVWSFHTGVSLLRSSKFDNNWESSQLNDKLLRCIAVHTGNSPCMIYVNDEITPAKIAVCYERLRRACSVDSYDRFASRDKDWLTRIHNSGWLQLVHYCFSMTGDTLNWLVDRDRSVIISETDGFDLSAVVSSLVQICCDRYFRKLEGLDALIAKEWIALGHPFAERLLGIPNGSNETLIAPTFLLFLDCVAQLIRLYPMQFSYTQFALIALWDLSLTGIVPAFSATCVGDQISSRRCGGPFPLERFFHESYTRLFSSITNAGAVAVQRSSGIALTYDVIRPPRTLADIMLWNECYLRWIPSANVTRGGHVLVDMAIKEKLEIVCPESKTLLSRFGVTNFDPEKVSSAYPYSEADLTHRGYFSGNDNIDTLSISSMSLSTSSQIVDDKAKQCRSKSISRTIY
ncbi:Tyrosine-protein kinase csk-1, variant 3 [Parelaphostrongylus tenuis]|uniref:Tyrosine-protein kinase csk-1, variant 3 n=1 Tax=Parelaphostrongylus tenuis TaxID=148309 RepID=A0AAD5QXT3_PARTN|nr:Tyrosine-protein kinase csk-1, variant 3 [Parelaphostrongylus tenuis]